MKKINTIEKKIAGLALVFICAISLSNVVVRYTTNISFAFTEEISVALLVIVAIFGAAFTSLRHEHIRIDALEHRLQKKSKIVLWTIQWLVSLTIIALIIYYGTINAYQEYEWQSTSPGLGLPTWIYLIWLPIGAIFMLIRLTQSYILRVRGKRVS